MAEEQENLREKAESQILHVAIPGSGVITGAGKREEVLDSQ